MKPLIVLIIVFVLASFVLKFNHFDGSNYLAGTIAMAAMLVFTAMGHFVFTTGMAMMVPDVIPYKKAVVYLTGVIELTAAIGLLIPASFVITGWLLIIFFVLMTPANINAAIRRVDYQKGTYEGEGIKYLWFRLPLQLFFIVWVYVCIN